MNKDDVMDVMYALSFLQEGYPNTYRSIVGKTNFPMRTINVELMNVAIKNKVDTANNTDFSDFTTKIRFSIMTALFVIEEKVYIFCINMEQGDVVDMVCCEKCKPLAKTRFETIAKGDTLERIIYTNLDQQLLHLLNNEGGVLNEKNITKTYCKFNSKEYANLVACYYYLGKLYIAVAYDMTTDEVKVKRFTFD